MVPRKRDTDVKNWHGVGKGGKKRPGQVTESVTARCGGGVEGRAIESDSVPTCVRGMCGRPVPGLLARSSFFF
jgi:hypothetical protein